MNRAIHLLCLVTLIAVGVSGCGGNGGNTTANATTAPGETAAGKQTEGSGGTGSEKPPAPIGKDLDGAVFAAEGPDLGITLYDGDGFSLYTFGKDKGTTSTCYGACAKAWPPHLTQGKPRPVDVSAAKLGTTKRKGGTIQITYAGHPLYTFAGDKQTGATNGNDTHAFGGEWYAIRPNGEKP